MWSDGQRFALSKDVVSRVISGEAVVLDLASQTYFGLNAVGTRVWEHLQAGRSVKEIRDALLKEFEVAPDALEKDVVALLNELTQKGLVSPL